MSHQNEKNKNLVPKIENFSVVRVLMVNVVGVTVKTALFPPEWRNFNYTHAHIFHVGFQNTEHSRAQKKQDVTPIFLITLMKQSLFGNLRSSN